MTNRTVTLWHSGKKDVKRFSDWATSANLNKMFTSKNKGYTIIITFTDEKAYMLFCLTYKKVEGVRKEAGDLFVFPDCVVA